MRRLAVLLLLAGCRQIFGLEPPARSADAGADAPIPDGGPCAAASAECVADVLRTCSAAGALPVDTTCTWGCLGPAAHCGAVVPAGGAVTAQDLAPDAILTDITLNTPSLIIDGDSGAIGTLASPNALRASGTGVINGIDYAVRGNVAVFRFASLTAMTTVTPYGSHAIALVAPGMISVPGTIDMRAPCINAGALGGSPGGGAAANGSGAGGGVGAGGGPGGGGGGYGGTGGRGGLNPASGGVTYGNATITTLVGGSGGGGGYAAGGAGGGALQLISGTQISIAGGINAGGCGGRSSASTASGGAGGGAGGTILLEAPTISILGKLAVNGGGGGGVGSSSVASNGTLDRSQASGGSGGIVTGALGAAGATLNGANGAVSTTRGAGGGGSIGRIRIDTRDGTATLGAGSVLSPAPTDPGSTCTVATAAVQ